MLAVERPEEVARLRGLSPEEFVPKGLLEAYRESVTLSDALALKKLDVEMKTGSVTVVSVLNIVRQCGTR